MQKNAKPFCSEHDYEMRMGNESTEITGHGDTLLQLSKIMGILLAGLDAEGRMAVCHMWVEDGRRCTDIRSHLASECPCRKACYFAQYNVAGV